jgi:hypothetical protein
MSKQGRKKADGVLLMSLACGATVEAAAAKAGVGVATVYRRQKDPEFCKLLNKTRADLLERTMGMLTGAAGEAVKTLLALMREAPAAVRLGAVRAALEFGIRVREVQDLAQRIAAIEEQLQPPSPVPAAAQS